MLPEQGSHWFRVWRTEIRTTFKCINVSHISSGDVLLSLYITKERKRDVADASVSGVGVGGVGVNSNKSLTKKKWIHLPLYVTPSLKTKSYWQSNLTASF